LRIDQFIADYSTTPASPQTNNHVAGHPQLVYASAFDVFARYHKREIFIDNPNDSK